ncbi:MAG: peptidoglycan-binding protein, partial [Clostridia bacterium]
MKQHTHMRKSAVLGSLLLALLLLLNGCFIQPDRTVKDPLTTDVDTLPFENVQPLTTQTPTPSPIPAPSATEVTSSGWEDWSGGGNTAMPTRQPVVTSYQSAPPAPTQRPVVAAATPKDETLRFGDSNQEVQDMQRALQSLGYYNGSVDGKFANGTQTAVSEFQRANGLSVDGIAGARTLDRLYGTQAVSKPKATAAPTMAPIPTTTNYRFLQEGGSGSDVKKLQQRLKTLGYFQGSVNGNFSVDTKQAVMAFQQNNKLWVDGVAGADTQSMIYSPYAAAASDTVSSGYRTLKEGMNGSDVVRLQQKLSSLGYLATTPDGYYGAQTVSAVRAFQQNNALSVDGVAGSGTQKRLFSGKANAATGPAMGNATPMPQTGNGTLREGDIGDAVYRLQERLYDLGYYTGRIDGAYGSAVTGAVRQFQRKHGL